MLTVRSNIVIFFLVLSASAFTAQDARESRTVQTTQGLVKGYKTDDVFHFYGIPYATAPTGVRRFTAPLPGPVWMYLLEAIDNKIICPQGESTLFDKSKYEMREDCLVAHIHVPDTELTQLPVVVYIHGGAYQVGYGEIASTNSLVQTKKLIAVTFNYRLGVHGFLCLGTENAPGNAGMKDQVALLRWVQTNIANFGGNPGDVTISGYSAGSSSVDLLTLSDMTKGLFSKAILESGAGIGVWSIQLDPVQNAKGYAKELNFDNADGIDSLDKFYSNLSYDNMTTEVCYNRSDSTFMFSPCVESYTGVEKFLNDTPLNILSHGEFRKVPTLSGFSNMDGLYRSNNFEQWKDKMNEKFSDFLPADLQFKNNEEREQIAQVVKQFYFEQELVSEKTFQGFIDYFSDVMFAYPHLRSVNLEVKAGSDSIYLYTYSFFRPYSEVIVIPEYVRNVQGAGHCSQTFAVLKSEANDINFGLDSDEYKRMKEIMVELWTNFITTGKPVPKGSILPPWPPVDGNSSPHMELGQKIELKGPLLEKRALFWDSIYEKFYKSPVAPSHPMHGIQIKHAPLPGPLWMHPLEAVNTKIICPQGKSRFLDFSKLDMREDCLVAHVHVPDTEVTNLPVVVYVHGGAYKLGSGLMGSTNSLVRTKKLIAVTFNYRLGAHGFLCLGTENAPGNAGMKDQVALLRWVQKNIANFGGNPSDVTIAGYSSGSNAVDLLMLSDMTKGLFSKAIPESGAGISVKIIQLDPVQNAKDFAKHKNFADVDDIENLDKFYSTLPYDVLSTGLFFNTTDSTLLFSPCVERHTGAEKFLDDTPVNILTRGKFQKVPTLYGFANMEGIYRVPQFERWKDKMNEKFSDFLPADLQFKNIKEREQIAQTIKRFYFGEKPVSAETIQGFIDYFSDVMVIYPILRTVKLFVEGGNNSIFLYEYSFFGPYRKGAVIPEYMKHIKGAAHSSQAFVIQNIHYSDYNPASDSNEYKVMKGILVKLWTNFITTGKPVPEGSQFPSWPPVGANRSPYMDLGMELKLKGTPIEKRALFWDGIYENFYKSPVPPSHTSYIGSEIKTKTVEK